MRSEDVWAELVGVAHRGGERGLAGDAGAALAPEAARLLDLYHPLASAPGRFVVAHLGQSLDGRIALDNGASRWITGAADVTHTHRMRALFQAVLVGRETVLRDDPQLTVREVEGPDPVRVVLDLRGRLDGRGALFEDDAAPTLVVRCRGQGATQRLGRAEIAAIDAPPDEVTPAMILDALGERGLVRIFVEGGGVTISRFLAGGCLDRLQITVAPVVLGAGRHAIALPPLQDMTGVRRFPYRRFVLGDDVMIELVLRG